MIAEALARLESEFATGNRSPAEQHLTLLELENALTPQEFSEVTSQIRDRFANAHAVLDKLHLCGLLARQAPARFERKIIAPDVKLFHDPDVSRADKTLIIGFCGKGHRLMLSTGTMLQLLPRGKCDLVVLKDPRRNHFVDGSRDYAPDFFQLITRLAKDLQFDRYKEILFYGASMGGFVALRAGLLLGTRAVSIGGRFPWRIRRMLERKGATTDAFELLCACKDIGAARLICVYATDYRPDAAAIDHLETILPVTRWPIAGMKKHNIVLELLEAGTLPQFYRSAFGFDPLPLRIRLQGIWPFNSQRPKK